LREKSVKNFNWNKIHLYQHNFLLLILIYLKYSKACLIQTPLGLRKLFSLDRCLVYTGSNYIDIK
jgi:hypothetical protein